MEVWSNDKEGDVQDVAEKSRLIINYNTYMKIKKIKDFMLEEYAEMSPRSQYMVDLTLKAEGECILVKNKRQWRLMKNEDVLVVVK